MSTLLDTDVLIDYLRGQADAVRLLENELADACLSTISVAELYQGVREGRERTQLAAGLFSRDYRASHGCNLADCLIAATADLHRLPLLTLNLKHYPMLKTARIPYRK